MSFLIRFCFPSAFVYVVIILAPHSAATFISTSTYYSRTRLAIGNFVVFLLYTFPRLYALFFGDAPSLYVTRLDIGPGLWVPVSTFIIRTHI